MKLKIKGGFIEDDASVAGLFDCTMKYEIKNTKAMIDWKGPKIPLDVWNEVLSFFQWCYDTYHSECQVRLYVSPTLQTWKAYAYPQEAKTGMTAHELDNDAKREQHAALGLLPPDWFAFGTVHHHCSMSAFQSGTDRENEESQDGLHITIGNMNSKDRYDIHARLYRKGLVIKNENLNMSWFVDTAPILAECPEKFRAYLPADWADKQARRLLTTPPAEIAFPQQWKDNVIEIKPVVSNVSGSGYFGGSHQCPSMYSSETEPLWHRVNAAWKEITYKCVAKEIPYDDVEQAIGDLALQDFAPHIICMACRHHKVDPDDLERQGPQDLQKEFVEEALQQQKDREDRKKSLSGEGSDSPKTNTNEEEKRKEADGRDPVGGTGKTLPGMDPDEEWNRYIGM